MEDDDAATRAVNAINGSLLNNRQLKVEKSESKGPRKPSQKLFVGNIKEGTTNEELKEVGSLPRACWTQFSAFCSRRPASANQCIIHTSNPSRSLSVSAT
jgi:hypothetical protein